MMFNIEKLKPLTTKEIDYLQHWLGMINIFGQSIEWSNAYEC